MGDGAVPMKVVGRRRVDRDGTDWRDVGRLLRTAGALIGGWRCAAGVYRFSSFDEANEWMTRMMTSMRVPRRSKTSRGSAAR